jgi:hypothetical protein
MDWAIWEPGRDHVLGGTQVKPLPIQVPLDPPCDTRSGWRLLMLRPQFAKTFERIGIIFTYQGDVVPYGEDTMAILDILYQETPDADYFIV